VARVDALGKLLARRPLTVNTVRTGSRLCHALDIFRDSALNLIGSI